MCVLVVSIQNISPTIGLIPYRPPPSWPESVDCLEDLLLSIATDPSLTLHLADTATLKFDSSGLTVRASCRRRPFTTDTEDDGTGVAADIDISLLHKEVYEIGDAAYVTRTYERYSLDDSDTGPDGTHAPRMSLGNTIASQDGSQFNLPATPGISAYADTNSPRAADGKPVIAANMVSPKESGLLGTLKAKLRSSS